MTGPARDWRAVVEDAVVEEAVVAERLAVRRPADPDAPMFSKWDGTVIATPGEIDLTDRSPTAVADALAGVEARLRADLARIETLLAEDRAVLHKRLASFTVQLAVLEEQLAELRAALED